VTTLNNAGMAINSEKRGIKMNVRLKKKNGEIEEKTASVTVAR
jgi:hypothetical protein